MAELSVLIVDDDKIDRYLASKLLASTGHPVSIAMCENGMVALDMIKQAFKKKISLPDLIFLDINMPVMNGWEFLKKIKPFFKKLEQQIFIYIVTSSQDESDMEYANRFSYLSGYLVKPVLHETYHEILATVAKSKK